MDVLIRLLMIIIVLVVNAVVGHYRGRGIQAGDPLAFWISYLFIIVYLLYTWKNKFELVKRCILAAPFAPLSSIVFKVVGFETHFSILVGIGIFLFMVIKIDDWKRHFVITLLAAVPFAFLLVLLRWRDSNEYLEISEYKVYVIFGLTLPFIVFYAAYLSIIDLQKTVVLRPLAVRSLKFTVALILFFSLFVMSEKFCRHYQLGLAISLMISILISLCFVGVCYVFKIGLSESPGSQKDNKIGDEGFLETTKK